MRTRALLVFNPSATTTDDRVRDVIAASLSSELDLVVEGTTERGHATDLAGAAVADGVDAVFSLGGDGTANEVIQALAGTDVAFGVIPGGGTNVLARAWGLPNDPIAATSVALDRLRTGRRTRRTLGSANGRWFGIIAGFGFDAAVVEAVEAHPGMKSRLRQGAFVLLGLQTWFRDAAVHAPEIEVTVDGTTTGPFGIVIVGNGDPYTFLGPRPLRVTPHASLDGRLDVTAVDRVGTLRILGILGKAFTGGRHTDDRHVTTWHDLPSFTLTSSRPLPIQVDGDHMGAATRLELASHPDALTVLG